MTCLSELDLAMHADGALTADAVAAAESHLAGCAVCSARLDVLRAEANLIAMTLAHEANAVRVPDFARPTRLRAFWMGSLLLASATFVSAAPTLLGAWLPAPFSWLNPFEAWGVADLVVSSAIYLAQHGGDIMTSITETAVAVVLVGLVAWLAFSLRKSRGGPLLVSLLMCLIVALPTPSHAIEIRRVDDGRVVVPAGEVIADTLVALGESVEIDGDVQGDLIAVGRRVAIRGHVGGQVITGAEVVTIEGDIDGSVIGFAETLEVAPKRIGNNLFGFGSTVSIKAGTIEQNAVVFARRADFAGAVGRDVLSGAQEIEISSSIGRNARVLADRVSLLAPTRIAGDLRATVSAEDHLSVSPGAVIGGKVETDVTNTVEKKNRYATGEFYVFQLLRFGGAFVTGMLVLFLVPGLRRAVFDSVGSAVVAGGVGLVALIAAPIVAVLVAITIVGIPLAVLGLLSWLVGIYLAKIVLAHWLGARLLDARGSTSPLAAALAVGLLVVIVAINLPFIGGLLSFVATCCGFGLLVLTVWRGIVDQPRASEAG